MKPLGGKGGGGVGVAVGDGSVAVEVDEGGLGKVGEGVLVRAGTEEVGPGGVTDGEAVSVAGRMGVGGTRVMVPVGGRVAVLVGVGVGEEVGVADRTTRVPLDREVTVGWGPGPESEGCPARPRGGRVAAIVTEGRTLGNAATWKGRGNPGAEAWFRARPASPAANKQPIRASAVRKMAWRRCRSSAASKRPIT
jgi:hypothetical protein